MCLNNDSFDCIVHAHSTFSQTAVHALCIELYQCLLHCTDVYYWIMLLFLDLIFIRAITKTSPVVILELACFDSILGANMAVRQLLKTVLKLWITMSVSSLLFYCKSLNESLSPLLSLSVMAAMQRATTVTPAPPWCTAAARSTAYTHMESSGAYR